MKIRTGGKELLESATFLALGLGETVVTIGSERERLNFVFNFEEEEGKKEAIKWEAVDTKTLKITLSNWNNTLGTSLVEPVRVGTYQERQLFILFYIKKAGMEGQNREVTFSLYRGEEVHVGAN